MKPIELKYHSTDNGFSLVRYKDEDNRHWVIQDSDGLQICTASKDWEADTPIPHEKYGMFSIEIPKGKSSIDRKVKNWLEWRQWRINR